MTKSRFQKSIIALLVCLSLCLAFVPGVLADIGGSEMDLNPDGAAFEMNADSQGLLWVSDQNAGEIWAIDPLDESNRVFPVGGSPVDARRVGTSLWWGDAHADGIGRADTNTGAFTIWNVPDSNGLYGTSVDSTGRLWASDAEASSIYRLDPAAAGGPQLCTYTLPDMGQTRYMANDGGNFLWFGDIINARLMRVNINDASLRWWALPASAEANSVAVDPQGRVWYGDAFNLELGRVEPDATQSNFRRYDLPAGESPIQLTLQGGLVWYTGWSGVGPTATVGRLDPAAAAATIADLTGTAGSPLVSSCATATVSSSGSLTPWPIDPLDNFMTPVSYPSLVTPLGWQAYEIVAGTGQADPFPWGIASSSGFIWFVDSGRQVASLLSNTPLLSLYLPVINR